MLRAHLSLCLFVFSCLEVCAALGYSLKSHLCSRLPKEDKESVSLWDEMLINLESINNVFHIYYFCLLVFHIPFYSSFILYSSPPLHLSYLTSSYMCGPILPVTCTCVVYLGSHALSLLMAVLRNHDISFFFCIYLPGF